MASDLPDALEKLLVNETLSANSSATSLSKYFGQPDNADDIFDSIVKPRAEEPKVDLLKKPNNAIPNTEEKAQVVTSANSPFSPAPAVSFQKRDNDEEPKIFSYFAQSPTNAASTKDAVASDFFDQISQQVSKSQEPLSLVISDPVHVSSQQQPGAQPTKQLIMEDNLPKMMSEGALSNSYIPAASHGSVMNPAISGTNVHTVLSPFPPTVGSVTPIFSHQTAALGDLHYSDKSWDQSQERASNWWIPSKETQQLLDVLIASPSKALPDTFKATTPGLSNIIEMADPIQGLLRHFDGETAAANRQTLTADSVTQDDKGIRNLIQAGCWRAAVNLCGRLLTTYGQGYGKVGTVTKHTPHSLQLWFTRLSLLVKAQQLDAANAEMAAFGHFDAADLYYEFHPELYGNRRGSMVPFSFRLLAAALPAHNHKINEAQDKTCHLLATVRKIIANVDTFLDASCTPQEKEDALLLWADREVVVIHSLVNIALLKKDYHNAVRLLHQQLRGASRPSAPLFSILGRTYLQLGDVVRAQRAFNAAADLRDGSRGRDAVASLMDAALVAIAQNSFSEAYGHYQQALVRDPDNALLVNNAAVCLLYMGRMQESMMLLEENLGTKPALMLHNATVLNVCTLYELESSLTTQRKLGMLRLASQWRNDNLNSTCFKLQT